MSFPVYSVTVTQNVSINSFNAGELSPLMVSRTDFAKYKAGALTLENMIVTSQGPIQRRPGTKYIAAAKYPTDAVRLITFEYSTDDSYIIEMGHLYMRFYRTASGISGQIIDANVPYEIVTLYDGNDLLEIQFAQNSQYMRFVHPDYAPYKLTRTGHTSWTLSAIDFINGPFQDENSDTSVTITPPAASADITTENGAIESGHYSTYDSNNAFNNNLTSDSAWVHNDTTNVYIGQNYGSAKTITKIKIWPCSNISYPTQCPKHVKVEASANGSDWTKISINRWYGVCDSYNGDEAYIYKINLLAGYAELWLDNDDAYQYWRVFITDNWGWTYVAILEMEMYEDDSGIFTTTSGIFDANHVGSIWKLTGKKTDTYINGTLSEHFTSSQTLQIQGSYTFTAGSSTYSALVFLEKSDNKGATWTTVKPYFSDGSAATNESYAGTETELGVIYRVRISDFVSGSCKYSLTAYNPEISGIIKITAYNDSNSVNADIIEPLPSTNLTYKWSEGAWSNYRCWPRTISMHEQRCVYGGSVSFPQTIWSSVIATSDSDYDNFDEGDASIDSQAWIYTLPGMNPIQWLVSQDYLMVGTTAGIGRLGSSDSAIVPTQSPIYRLQARTGSDYIQGVAAIDNILYVERGGQKVREVSFTYTTENYIAPDLTVFAEHITESGITSFAFQNRPYPILWCVLNDGDIATLTYNKHHEVVAWSEITTDGNFVSVAVQPGLQEDEVWFAVERIIDSNTVRYIEQMQPFKWGNDANDMYFVDCGVDDPNNLSHLEGKSVSLFANGAYVSDYNVSGGAIDFNDPNLTVFTAGLPYTSVFKSMPLITSTDLGLSASKRTTVLDLNLDLYQTKRFDLGTDSTHVTTQNITSLFSGWKPTLFPRGENVSPSIYISIDEPTPFTLRAMAMILRVEYAN